MKAQSTIVELAETALPVFGDPDRDYDYLSLVRAHTPVPGGVEATVESFEGVEARVRFQFVAPEIVRVQYVLDREPPASTPMLDGPPPAPIDVRVEAGERAIEIDSGAARLRIDRRPFRWTLLRGDETIAAQEVHDGALARLVSLPAGWSAPPGGARQMHETLSLRADERIYGLGESFAALDRRGTRVVSWSRDPYGTNTTPLTYINIPFFWSTRGYGVFVNQSSRAVYEIGYPSQVALSFRFEEPYLDYFVIAGPDPSSIVRRYWSLTGSGRLPPLWSFGVWMSRCMYRDAEQVRGVVERLDGLDIPVDVVNIDPRWLAERKHRTLDGCDFVWDREAFDEPEDFVRWLAERDVRLCLWENPYVWRDTGMFREGLERGLFATTPDGEPAPSLENADDTVVVDFTNAEAARWWQDKHRPYLRAGVAAFKSDYGEAVPADARFSDGGTGIETHNVYPLLYNRAVYEVIEEERGEAVVFGRSGYAGSQRYPINWVGDTQCTFEGMAAALRAGLSLSASGVPFWSHDIGGFWNPPDPGQPPDPELYIRWAQWGLLSSHARFHGVRGREPWWFGDEAVDVVRRFAKLRTRLLPYLWSFANEAVGSAMPLVRPLAMEFPDDPMSERIDHEYLLGPWLLVAPVLERGGRVRPYLPPGRWTGFWTGEVIEGPRWLDLTAPPDRLPVYVRDDSLLVLGAEARRVGQGAWRPLDITVRLSSGASLRVANGETELEVTARRNDGIDLELAGKATLELHFAYPAAERVEARGGAAVTGERRLDGTLTASVDLEGRGSIRAS